MARAFLAGLVLLWLCTTASAQQPTLAGDHFEHVTVLHRMPADQMGKVMNIMSEALGVGCAHCHAGYDFAREDVPKKTKAREMLTMTISLNEKHFGGQTVVTCMTCHQGQMAPVNAQLSASAFASLQNSSTASSNTSRRLPVIALKASKADPVISVDQVLEAYQRAMKPVSATPTTTQRELKAVRIEPSGKEEPETILLTLPNKWEQRTHYGQLIVTELYDQGKIEKRSGESKIDLKAEEAEQVHIEAHIALGLKLTDLFNNWEVGPAGSIGDRAMYVLKASRDQRAHTFYFDRESGLLRRRSTSMATVLGAYIVEVDYEDYQVMDGLRVPLKTYFNRPSVRWERRLVP